MYRKLILASAVSLALLPGAVGALGLGGIGTESALNEPFSGQIELSDVQPDDLAAVKVLLASETEFEKVGAPRPDLLNQLSFSTGVSADGKPVIRVSTKEPVREPYLEFLIEVTWPNGRLIQEYTVLLDPPVTVDRAPPPVVQPAVAAPKPQPIVRSAPPPPPKPTQAPPSADAADAPLRYGPVKPGDALWRIARKMARSSSASVEQIAMALYRNNQRAFIRGDINKLKVGKVLAIPSVAELVALDRSAATQEFQAALRGDAVTSTPLTDITTAPEPADRLQIAGKAEPTPAQETPPTARPEAPPEGPVGTEITSEAAVEPPVSSGADISTGDIVPELGTVKQDLLLVQEAGESTRQETEELRNRVIELETQLADIQRLLKLSDERFAQLQSLGLDQSGIAGAEGDDPVLPVVSAETAPAAGEGESDEVAPEPATDGADATKEAESEAEPAVDDSDQTPVQEPAFVTFLKSISASMWALALAVPTLLLVLGWMIRRRRRSLEESLKPADLTLDAQNAGAAAGVGEAASETLDAPQGSASSAPTLSPYSGFGDLEDETEEADIISEADVYIAYGRYREAESLLEDEIGKAPDRIDVKYKLAEAYYGARNREGMETLMAELQRAGGDRVNPDQWQRLNTMLHDLEGPEREAPGLAVGGDELPGTKAPELAERLAESFPPPIPSSRESTPGMSTPSFGVDSDLLTAVPPGSDAQGQLSRALELEVDDLDGIKGRSDTPASDEVLEVSGAASDLELQLEDLDSLRDVDLAAFSDLELPTEPPSAEPPASLTTDAKGDLLDIAPVGKDSLASDVLSSQWQMDSGMWDEVATKIDLARAYMEMEDAEAARVILEEVAHEGNEGQRAEAKEMLAQLG